MSERFGQQRLALFVSIRLARSHARARKAGAAFTQRRKDVSQLRTFSALRGMSTADVVRMRVVVFCHSLLSDWNHGSAHFLRGVTTELAMRGHDVRVYEPRDAWSVMNLVRDHGEEALFLTQHTYPFVTPRRYLVDDLDLDEALDGAGLVIVHEWNEPDLVARIGAHRRASRSKWRLLFHDTHHRAITDERAMEAYDLSGYDGVLAFGAAIRDVYARKGWARRAFVWREAADVRVFRPMLKTAPVGDLVWIGNWGDETRARELAEFLLEPVKAAGIRARAHGVRFPDAALAALTAHGIEPNGWLPSFHIPEVFASFRMTIHVPRRPFAKALLGMPSIRVFEALACGIPLIRARWEDTEGLFVEGRDFLVARSTDEMTRHVKLLASDPAARLELAERGRRTVLTSHTTAHRVDELLAIANELGASLAPSPEKEAHP
jgi:spore maturation protein CgeB